VALWHGEFDLVITDMAMETPTAGYDVVRAAREGPYRPEAVILTVFPLPNPNGGEAGQRPLSVRGGQTLPLVRPLTQEREASQNCSSHSRMNPADGKYRATFSAY
jgi:CheY-like chemotaxis protein